MPSYFRVQDQALARVAISRFCSMGNFSGGIDYWEHNHSIASPQIHILENGPPSAGQLLEIPNPPFQSTEHTCEMRDVDGTVILPQIDCSLDKGFFKSAQNGLWTFYRRNYFAATCSYCLSPSTDINRLQLSIPGPHQIHGFALGFRAYVDGIAGEKLELTRHCSNRNSISKHNLPFVVLSPATKCSSSSQRDSSINHLALTNVNAEKVRNKHSSHSFDRVQFRQSTKNNGKRRANQQYFKLVVELWVTIAPMNHIEYLEEAINSHNGWIKVAQRRSTRLIVIGRSPSHYQSDIKSALTQHGGFEPPAPISSIISTSVSFPRDAIARFDTFEQTEAGNQIQLPNNHTSVPANSVSEALNYCLVSPTNLGRSILPSIDVKYLLNSPDKEQHVAGPFAKVILGYGNIRLLSQVCFILGDALRMERNVERLLEILAINIRYTAGNETDRAIAHALRRNVKNVAKCLKQESTTAPMPDAWQSLSQIKRAHDYATAARSSDMLFELQRTNTLQPHCNKINSGEIIPNEFRTFPKDQNTKVTSEAWDAKDLEFDENGGEVPNDFEIDFERVEDSLHNNDCLEEFQSCLRGSVLRLIQ